MDWPLMLAVGALLSIGLVAVYSAVSPMGTPMHFMFKQIGAIMIGLLGLFLLSSLNYQLFRGHPGVLYVLSLMLLVLVLVVGRKIHGAKSWIVMGPISFEPVEIARIGFILVVAALLDRAEREVSSFRLLALVFALAGIQMVLILKEPYLGGTLVYVPVLLGMLYFAGVRPIYLLAIVFYAGVAVGIPIISTYFSVQPQLLTCIPSCTFSSQERQGFARPLNFYL